MSDFDYEITRILRVKDGDTFVAILSKDIGFHVTAQANVTIRVLNIDTYELHKGSPEDRAKGQAARNFTANWLDTHPTARVTTTSEDSFGRWLGIVYTPEGQYLASDLLQAGFQKPDSEWGPQ